jgi:hypothetical protein
MGRTPKGKVIMIPISAKIFITLISMFLLWAGYKAFNMTEMIGTSLHNDPNTRSWRKSFIVFYLRTNIVIGELAAVFMVVDIWFELGYI